MARRLMRSTTLGGHRAAVSAATAPLRLATLMLVYLNAVGVSKVPKSDAAKMFNRTVAILGDEENCVIALNVFHQLQCLVSCKFQSHPLR